MNEESRRELEDEVQALLNTTDVEVLEAYAEDNSKHPAMQVLASITLREVRKRSTRLKVNAKWLIIPIAILCITFGIFGSIDNATFEVFMGLINGQE